MTTVCARLAVLVLMFLIWIGTVFGQAERCVEEGGDLRCTSPGYSYAYCDYQGTVMGCGTAIAWCHARGGQLVYHPWSCPSCEGGVDVTEANMAQHVSRFFESITGTQGCPVDNRDSGWGQTFIDRDVCWTVMPTYVSGVEVLNGRIFDVSGATLASGCTERRSLRFIGRRDRDLFCPAGYVPLFEGLAITRCRKVNDGTCPVGKPSQPGTGSETFSETDIAATSASALSFSRTYHSFGYFVPLHQAGQVRGQLGGSFWRSIFDRQVFANHSGDVAAIAMRADGSVRYFLADGSETRGDGKVGERLVRIPATGAQTGWQYSTRHNEQEYYDLQGRLLSIVQPQGQTLSLSYTDGFLSQVRDERGRRLRFEYTQGFLSTITTEDGAIYRYEYNEKGNLNRIRYPDNTQRRYRYENTLFPSALTDIFEVTSTAVQTRIAHIDYDGSGRVLNSALAPEIQEGRIGRHQFEYNPDGTTTITDPLGHSKTLTFVDVAGTRQLQSSTEACPSCGGSQTQLREYTTRGFLDSSTDFRGVVTHYQRDSQGRELRRDEVANTSCPETMPDCASSQRSTITRWSGSTNNIESREVRNASGILESLQRYVSNSRGQMTAQCQIDVNDAAAQAYVCSSLQHAPSAVTQIRRIYCDAVNNNPPDALNAPAENLQKACPIIGLIRRIDGPRTDVNDTTTYEYRLADASDCDLPDGICAYRRGDLWKTINALGQVTEYQSYDRAGRVQRLRDANGIVTEMRYQPRGWLAMRIVRAAEDGSERVDDIDTLRDAVTRMQYDAAGRITQVTQADGSSLMYRYDAAGRLIEIGDHENSSQSNRIRYTLDAAGNRIKEETHDASGQLRRVLARQFDDLNRLAASLKAPDAQNVDLNAASIKKTRYAYDANGNEVKRWDAANTEYVRSYDPLNRLMEQIDDSGKHHIQARSQYRYDALDQLREVIDPKGLSTRYTYNGLNQLTQLQSPDTGRSEYTYDAAGNRTSQTDARQIRTNYRYDALNRVQSIDYPQAELNIRFAYDQSDALTGCSQSYPQGRLTQISDASGSTVYCYDARGNVTHKVQTTSGTRLVTRMTYNLADRLTQIIYPSGLHLNATRDEQGRIQAMIYRHAAIDNRLIDRVTYLPFGPINTIRFANGRVLNKQYDQNYRIAALQGGTQGLDLNYTVDELDQIIQIDNGTNSRRYAYDKLHRLTEVRDANNATLAQYRYDATGNRQSTQTGKAMPQVYRYANISHRLQSIATQIRAYDASGNTLSDGNRRLQYDARNRLMQIEVNGTRLSNQYNGKGERVSKTLSAADTHTTLFMYDESGHLLGEYTASGQLIAEYIWLDDAPVALFKLEGLAYIESDHLNTPRAIIDPTRNTAVWRWDLTGDAFGAHAANDDADGDGIRYQMNLRYPGQYFDAESGLHYNYFRDYEPQTGRYVESDPIGLAGGVGTYGYAKNNPFIFTDQTGLLNDNNDDFLFDVGKQQTCAQKALLNAYRDMRIANFIGADKYFHCVGNCEAAKCGPIGCDESEMISFLREMYGVYLKGDDPIDSANDIRANDFGREGGVSSPNTSCKITCNFLRPVGLPGVY